MEGRRPGSCARWTLAVWRACARADRSPRSQAGSSAALAVALAFLFALALDGAAALACGAAKHATATKRGAGGRAPLVIGDSVLLGAVPQVAAAGFEVDTRGCRQMSEGLGIIAARRRAKTLPHFVVIALGANGSIATGQIREAMKLVGRDRILGLVTPRELGGGESSDARAIRAAGPALPRSRPRARLGALQRGPRRLVRRRRAASRPGGARGLARLLRRALPLAIAPLCP